MEKSQIRILIVEDDITLSKALGQAVKSAGYTPIVCTTPVDALSQAKLQEVQLMIVDCLLPKMSGVDLSIKLRQETGTQAPLILTSGIFKDKNFAKDAIQKTGAVVFLPKPFEVKELLKNIEEHLKGVIDEEVSPMESILFSTTKTVGEKIAAINTAETVHGFDLPWVAMLLSHPSTNGVLWLDKDNPEKEAALYFHKGRIVQVQMKNPESFFGALLVEKGFLEPEQLEKALKIPSTKRIGERLVDLNYLSPHVIDIINAEQTAMRLSRLITDREYKVTFEEKAVSENPAYLDVESLAPFLSDWIHTKITLDWLKARYLRYTDLEPMKVSSPVNGLRIWSLPPFVSYKMLITEFEKGSTLTAVLAQGKYREEVVYQVLHLLVTVERIRFKKQARAVDESAQLARLQRVNRDLEIQDYFTVLGVQRNVKPSDLKRIYHDLAKTFHPDRFGQNASKPLLDLAKEVFGKMTKAYEVLSNETKRASYLKELDMGKAEKVLQSEGLFEEGKTLLKSAQFKKAREKFEEAAKLRQPSSDLLVHTVWATLSTTESSIQEEDLRKAETTLNKIPPEDRHNAQYYFVKALFQKTTGDIAAAKKNLQHALSLNPRFLDAERVLRVLELQANKPVNILTGDLTAVVGSFFKRR